MLKWSCFGWWSGYERVRGIWHRVSGEFQYRHAHSTLEWRHEEEAKMTDTRI